MDFYAISIEHDVIESNSSEASFTIPLFYKIWKKHVFLNDIFMIMNKSLSIPDKEFKK